ncbi:MAG TPA: LytTR family DNA-binding domain-containing protein [Puia sp.]|nr:LytTR family DNA-binding domain-containing protein [Puia sp.]
MKVLIIEDEKPAYENLVQEMLQIDENMQVIAACTSVNESIKWLDANEPPDIIFMDIQLSDGHSFDIFKHCTVTCPVIFITAYDKYLTEAFDYNGIDYLLKPVSQQKLTVSIRKYKNLRSHFVNNHSALMDFLYQYDRKKSLIVVKKGLAFQMIRIKDVAYFYTEHKLVFLVDKSNSKYIADKNNLSELQEELDEAVFYRANRKYIINANYLKSFKSFERKVSVELTIPTREEILVSQENIVSFKKWINDV